MAPRPHSIEDNPQFTPELLEFQERIGCDERALAGLLQLPPGDQLVAMDIVENQQCNNPSAVLWAVKKRCQTDPIRVRKEYLRRHLDDRCLEAFNALAAPLQDNVCQTMDVANVRNLSAVVFSKIRSEQSSQLAHAAPQPRVPHFSRDRSRSPLARRKANGGAQLARPQPPTRRPARGSEFRGRDRSSPADVFRLKYQIDDRAARALEDMSPEDQFVVCGLVEKQNPRNPSAVTWSMCKLMRERPLDAKLEYIKHMIDDDADAALDRLNPHDLDRVLSKVDLSNVRNVSAFVWSRVKELSSRDSTEQESSSRSSAGQGQRKGQHRKVDEDPHDDMVDAIEITLDDRCQAEFDKLSPKDQEEILNSFDANVRNPSAYVWSRIRSLQK